MSTPRTWSCLKSSSIWQNSQRESSKLYQIFLIRLLTIDWNKSPRKIKSSLVITCITQLTLVIFATWKIITAGWVHLRAMYQAQVLPWVWIHSIDLSMQTCRLSSPNWPLCQVDQTSRRWLPQYRHQTRHLSRTSTMTSQACYIRATRQTPSSITLSKRVTTRVKRRKIRT